MSIEVACSTCHKTFPMETHVGLVRCRRCESRAAPRMESSGATVVEFEGVWI